MRQKPTLFILISVLLVLFVAFDLFHGLSLEPETWNLELEASNLDQMILLDLRLPRVLTAILAGMALSVSGLLMQTLFRNPLAGPYTLGVSSGASLGVALLTLLPAAALGQDSLYSLFLAPYSTPLAAILGALLILLLVIAVARRVRSNTSMLIVGLMFGSIAGALVNMLQCFANPDALKLFITWTFGSLSAVGWTEMTFLAPTIILALALSVALIKPLNGLALGENYARGLGIRVERLRILIVLATGLLAGGITAYCGPIAFIGVAMPHVARGLFATCNHRIILPATALIGATVLVACDILSTLWIPLPISTVSALFGAPVIIYIILKK